LDAEFEVQADGPPFTPTVTGTVTVRDLVVDRNRLTNKLSARVRLTADALRVDDLRGEIADGQLSGELVVPLSVKVPPEFLLRMRGVSLRRTTDFSRELARRIRGRFDVDLRGRLGPIWRGRGQIRLSQAELAGVRVSGVYAPFRWTAEPRRRRLTGHVDVRQLRVSGGQVVAKADLTWDGRLSVDGESRITGFDISSLARSFPEINDILRGQLDGEMTFAGKSIRSINDVSGTFDVSLQQSQALLLPALEELAGSLGLIYPASETFAETKANGTFRNGVVMLKRMTMVSSDYRLWLEGVVRTNGSLNVDVTADTQAIQSAAVLIGVLRPIDFLRRRLLYFNIGGNIRSPIVRPLLDRFLEQECLLFFLPIPPAMPTS
jgi:hypothetical protein